MGCNPVKFKSRRVCIGDRNERIKIHIRTLTSNNAGSIESIETFIELVEVWAAVETTRGSQLWNGVEVSNPFTHRMSIRYRDNIDFNKWIEFRDEYYDIVDVENLEQKNEELFLMCIRKGDNTKEANFA